MRKTPHLVISLSVALVIGLLCVEMRTSAVTMKSESAAETDSSVFLNPTPQNAHFIWVPVDSDQSRPGYKRVAGGVHDDGTTMYICRAFGVTPGKLYDNSCHYSYAGQENVLPSKYEVLLTDVGYEWRSFDEVKRSEIKRGAVVGGSDSNGKDTLYICRKKMSDGRHTGKYSYKNNLCYIPWGNQERFYEKGFQILFPSE